MLYEDRPLGELVKAHLRAAGCTWAWARHFAPRLPGVRLERGSASLAWPRLFTGVFPLRLIRENGGMQLEDSHTLKHEDSGS